MSSSLKPTAHPAFLALLLAPLMFWPPAALADVAGVSLDKPMYAEGDVVTVSGSVVYDPDHPSGTIQILSPGGSLASVRTFVPDPDGSFSAIFQTGGTWSVGGQYALRVFYASDLHESAIDYRLHSEPAAADPPRTDDPGVPLLRDLGLDRSVYSEGDPVTVSGTADYSPDYPAVTVRIVHPDGHLVGVYSPRVEPDGAFSSTFQTGGKWDASGVYTVKASLASATLEQTLEYAAPEPAAPQPVAPEPAPVESPDGPASARGPVEPPSFVDPSKDPRHYVDRYDGEPAYRDWFDENFPQYSSIHEAVGLPEPLGTASFVDPSKDPRHYVDRYDGEPAYRDWFDENFPQYLSIYQAVGLPEPVAGDADEAPESDPGAPTLTCGAGTRPDDSGRCVRIPEPSGDPAASNPDDNGCLIATAAYGSEMAPQVQLLREVRDSTVLATQSGSAFMAGFNQLYYSFSPTVADWERQNPAFKEAVRAAITPLLATLSVLNHAGIDSEPEMLGYGLGIIAMNVGMYLAAPAVVIWKLKR